MDEQTGLRGRKKQRTRQALSDAATALFAARGFDAVTIAEIAATADVAVGTVFNYFRTKEELFFDRSDALEAALRAAITDRPPHESVVAAFRRWHDHEIAFLLDPRGAEATLRFFRTIAASPALQAAEHRLHQRLETALAQTLRPAGGPLPEVLAALLPALHRAVLTVVRTAVLTSEPAGDRAARATEAAFATLTAETHAWNPRVDRLSP